MKTSIGPSTQRAYPSSTAKDPVSSRDVDGDTGITLRELLSTGLDEGLGGGGERLVCRACDHPITSARARIAVSSATASKTNPAGLTFHIGCFRRAPGARGFGRACAEHSWFAGHTWRIALCGGCETHLGWAFQAAGEGFHGLILDRLRPENEGEQGPGR